jgi:hypothetical protein
LLFFESASSVSEEEFNLNDSILSLSPIPRTEEAYPKAEMVEVSYLFSLNFICFISLNP